MANDLRRIVDADRGGLGGEDLWKDYEIEREGVE